MAEQQHHFRLKLPNGAEIDFGGDKEFVTEVYRDTKSAAVTLFNREAGRTSAQQAVDRLLGPSDQISRPEQLSTTPPNALPHVPPATSRPPAAAEKAAPKDRKPREKPDAAQEAAKKERVTAINGILRAQTFDDYEHFTAAIGAATTPLDRAALVVRMAETKFGLDTGLTQVEVIKLLNDRFRAGQDETALKRAMKNAPKTFFIDGPAPFDGRARLYRSMKECIERVDVLLQQSRNPRLATASMSDGNGSASPGG